MVENSAQAFDLNVEKVLEHWTIPFAIRELIANALDEQMLTATAEPAIFKDGRGDWHIADQGRGLRYEHLTQNENAEKRRHPQVIGQFGMGLKDALAVFDRRGVRVKIFSPHADITTGRRPKEGFPDVVTLHALVSPPSDPRRGGTDVVLTGASDEDVANAKAFFLREARQRALQRTAWLLTGDRALAEDLVPTALAGRGRAGSESGGAMTRRYVLCQGAVVPISTASSLPGKLIRVPLGYPMAIAIKP